YQPYELRQRPRARHRTVSATFRPRLALRRRMGHHCACSDHKIQIMARKRMSKPSKFDQSSFSYGWVVVGAGAMMTCVGFGAMLSLAVFLQPISTAMGWSRSGV